MHGARLRLLLVLLVLTAFSLTALDARQGAGSPFDTLRRGADTVFAPALRAVGAVVGAVGDAVPRFGAGEDVARLERENAVLRGRLRETEALQRRDAELRTLLRLRTVADYPVVAARVVAVGSTFGFEWTATLDAGSRDGLVPGQTVLAGDGLVGRTKRVTPLTATVVLVADPAFTVGGRLQRLGGVGLLSGDGPQRMRYEVIDAGAQLRPGDLVATTPSDVFVPDVPVGRVTRVTPGASALTRVAEVQPFVDVTTLDLVGVVVGPARTGPRAPVRP